MLRSHTKSHLRRFMSITLQKLPNAAAARPRLVTGQDRCRSIPARHPSHTLILSPRGMSLYMPVLFFLTLLSSLISTFHMIYRGPGNPREGPAALVKKQISVSVNVSCYAAPQGNIVASFFFPVIIYRMRLLHVFGRGSRATGSAYLRIPTRTN